MRGAAGTALLVAIALGLSAPAVAARREQARPTRTPAKPPPPAPTPAPKVELPPEKPAPPAPEPPSRFDAKSVGLGGAALLALMLLAARITARRASRQPMRAEVVLDPGVEGRFHAALLPEEGPSLAAKLEAALQATPPEVLDLPLELLPAELKSQLGAPLRVQHLTELGKLRPGAYRVIAWGRSAPSRELSLRVGGTTAASSAQGVRTHVQERRVQLLEQPLTVHFDFRQARTRAVSNPGAVVSAASLKAAPPAAEARQAELQRRAREAFSAGRYDEAAKLFRELGDREQEARCYLFGGEPEKVARIDAEQAEARGEKTLAVNHYLRAKDRAAAIRVLRELGREPEALRLEAQAKMDAGERDAAISLFERAGDGKRAGELLESAGDPARAMAAYQRAGAWEPAGRLAAKQNDFELAARCFEQGGRHAEAAVVRLRLGQTDAARALADATLPGAPGELLALSVLARVHQGAGKVGELRGLALRAIGVPLRTPLDREALRALAAFCKQLAQTEAAQLLYQRLVDTDPVDLDAADALKALAGPSPSGTLHLTDEMAMLDERATQGAVSRAELQKIAARAPTAQSVRAVHATAALPQGNERYRIEAELGRGAMGVVYRASDQLLGREVALKMLAPEFTANEQLRRLFLDEARALAALNHPYVVQVYDLGELQGVLFLAMELATGETLEQVLARTPLLPLPQSLAILSELAGALEAAHGRRIVHRDVKPANVMITPGGAVKLMDFGIATGGGAQSAMVVGTPRYMAPEQIRGEVSDARADLYAFGVLAFELLTGTLPFPDDDVLQHHLNTPAPLLRSRRPGLPQGLEQLVARLLAKAREERPSSAAELQAILAAERARAA